MPIFREADIAECGAFITLRIAIIRALSQAINPRPHTVPDQRIDRKHSASTIREVHVAVGRTESSPDVL